MNNIQKKEKNLNLLINKLASVTSSYSQSKFDTDKISEERAEKIKSEQ